MNLNVNILLILTMIILYSALFIFLFTLINKFSSLDEMFRRNNRRLSMILSIVHKDFKVSFDSLRDLKSIKQNILVGSFSQGTEPEKLIKLEKREKRRLKSRFRLKRKEAAVFLGIIGTVGARKDLEEALGKENDYSTKIYISNSLTDIKCEESLSFMVEALIGTHKWYREKAISNILEFGDMLMNNFDNLKRSKSIEILELLIKYSGENFNSKTKEYLFDFVDNYDHQVIEVGKYYDYLIYSNLSRYKVKYLKDDMDELLKVACRTLSNIYYKDFQDEAYYNNKNRVIKQNSLWALSKTNSTDNFKIVLGFIDDQEYENIAINILSKMIEMNPRFLYIVEDEFHNSESIAHRKRLAQILSNKIEYYILKLAKKNDKRAEDIIISTISNYKVNELIGFLNINRDQDIENAMVKIFKENIPNGSEIETELRTYLQPRIVRKIGLTPLAAKSVARKTKKDPALIKNVIMITLLSITALPIYFTIINWNLITTGHSRTILTAFVIHFNYGLAYYSIAINAVYLTLLLFSYSNVKKQSKLWNLKNISMLFRNKMIPSISIIAPAYNEEKSIISSVQSLLNLNYPEYELIVVNDGSTDETLLKLINEFKLVRVDYIFEKALETSPIRGVYRNTSIPKLIVVDKSNGGKADSLNAGINISNKTYFCGIDADSLLEPDSLLKLASLTLDESYETPALGGNILPLNGCKVDKGLITEIRLPKKNIAKFQTIEYIRAFMAGRLGWEKINSLLIISGAFGLFRKDRIVGVGGYLTEKGKYKKDTVGEDMELVVRITKFLSQIKQPSRILYAFNANCWTEVPEDIKSLRNQRLRWHRGLIDILYFHRDMFLNPKYGRIGMIAMPYYMIFEFIGPLIEIQGYIMVVLAAILGILDAEIALLLFIATILFGIIISLTSLLIAERETHYFTFKDLMILVLFAIIENFGPRQVVSFWRIRGQFSILFGKGGWGHIKRRGV